MKSIATRLLVLRGLGCLLALALALPGFGQGWRWARAAGGAGNDQATTVVTDSLGNQYVGGSFAGLASFGARNLTSGGASDGFIAKLDSTGAWLWVQQLRGADSDIITRLRLDEANGAVLVVGYASASATLGGTALPTDTQPGFVARLNAATGTVQWSQRASSVTDVGADKRGHLTVCGSFLGDTLTLGSLRAVNSSIFPDFETDMYVAGLSADGSWEWVVSAGGEGDQNATDLVVDASGAAYVGGSYMTIDGFGGDSARFGPYALPYVTSAEENYYVAKISVTHAWEWAKAGFTDDRSGLGGLAAGPDGRLYVTGWMNDDALLFGADTVLVHPGTLGEDVGYILCLTPQGRPRWTTRTTYGSTSVGQPVATRGNRLVVSGVLYGDSVVLGPYQLTSNDPATGYSFVAVLDSGGRWQWAGGLPEVTALGVDRRLRVTLVGGFHESVLTLGGFTLANPAVPLAQAYAAEFVPPALIDALTPATGPAGTVVVLTGTGFAGTTGVWFGNVPATAFTVLTDGRLLATAPAGLPTIGPGVVLRLDGPNGTALSNDRFRLQPLGLAADAMAAGFSLAPNPARNHARLLGLPVGAPTTQLIDALGRVVRRNAGADLDLRGLAPGVYVVRVGAATRRLVVE